MKKIRIILLDILHLFKNHTWLTLLLVTGFTVCDLMTLYFAGNIRGIRRNLNYPVFDADLTSAAEPDIEEFVEFLNSKGAKSVFYAAVETDSLKNDKNTLFDISKFEESLILNGKNGAVLYLVAFSDKPIQRLDKGDAGDLGSLFSVALPATMQGTSKIGDDFSVYEKTFRVVGYEMGNYAYISLNTLLSGDFIIPHIEIRLNSYDKKAISDFEDELNERLNESYSVRKRENADENESLDYLTVVMILLFIICAFSVLYMVSSIFYETSYESGVYYLIGAKKTEVVFILAGVQLVFLVLGAVIASSVHRILWAPLFSGINLCEISYSPGDYPVFLLPVTISMLIIETAVIVYQVKSSPVEYIEKRKK